jgi:hypothetical protein
MIMTRPRIPSLPSEPRQAGPRSSFSLHAARLTQSQALACADVLNGRFTSQDISLFFPASMVLLRKQEYRRVPKMGFTFCPLGFIIRFYSRRDRYGCGSGGIGRRVSLRSLWSKTAVWVRVPPSAPYTQRCPPKKTSFSSILGYTTSPPMTIG